MASASINRSGSSSGLNAFVGHDRSAHVLAHKGHAAHVFAPHRLFEHDQIPVFELVQDFTARIGVYD